MSNLWCYGSHERRAGLGYYISCSSSYARHASSSSSSSSSNRSDVDASSGASETKINSSSSGSGAKKRSTSAAVTSAIDKCCHRGWWSYRMTTTTFTYLWYRRGDTPTTVAQFTTTPWGSCIHDSSNCHESMIGASIVLNDKSPFGTCRWYDSFLYRRQDAQ